VPPRNENVSQLVEPPLKHLIFSERLTIEPSLAVATPVSLDHHLIRLILKEVSGNDERRPSLLLIASTPKDVRSTSGARGSSSACQLHFCFTWRRTLAEISGIV
jgi:hypothetical protein